MADGPTYTMDPDAVLDFGFDWSKWLGPTEIILTSTVLNTPGITLDSTTNSNTLVTVWLSGGSAGQIYTVTSRITTSQGRTDDRTITIRATNR